MKKVCIFVLLCLLLAPRWARAESFTGKVLSALDGTNILVRRDDREVSVKFYGIECPEIGQASGAEAQDYVRGLLVGKDAFIDVKSVDHSRRLVSRVTVDGKDVSLDLAKAGLAWYDKKATYEPSLQAAVEDAKKEKKGLWAEENPVAPWDFRCQSRGIIPDFSAKSYQVPSSSGGGNGWGFDQQPRSDYGMKPFQNPSAYESSFKTILLPSSAPYRYYNRWGYYYNTPAIYNNAPPPGVTP
ncbi:MAG: thermonuclease family protein [Candidatus Eremiobacteraeota bacterium]|nr:thermonuclease family protein [Candidatus Eremiobacteraeota bacterium]